jgi:hypothetical protein
MSTSVYECEPTSAADALFHAPLFVQVFASIVVVVAAVLSLSVAVAQSYVTVSVQTTRYQKDSVPPPAGAVNVWATELSPLNGEPLPIIAEATPACAVEEIAVLPVWVHPVKPLSNPPFVIPLGGGTVTVSETLVLWLLLVAVPVTVTGYVPGGVPAPTVKVSVELPPALTDAGLKTAVVPEGRPLVLNAMLSALPPVIAVEMVEVPVHLAPPTPRSGSR